MDYEKEYKRLQEALNQSDHIRRQWQTSLKELKKTKSELKKAQEHLEIKVEERTAELKASNRALKAEIEHRKQIELSMRKLSFAVEQTGSVIIITNRKGIIEYVNPRFTEVTGYGFDEAKGNNPRILKSGETSIDTYREIWKKVLTGHHWRGEVLNRRKDGTTYWSYLSISPIEDEDGNITHLVGVSEDVSELKAAHDRMTRMALFDPLTELPNRRLLKEHIDQGLKESLREDKHLVLLFLDLDNFKNINDSLGHELGDLMLRTVANRLRTVLRENDMVARFGGDEFVVVLKEIADLTRAKLVAEKIMSGISKPISLKGRKVRTSASIGITLAPQDGTDPDILIRNADLAMYRAKCEGRNNYQFFTTLMNQDVANRVTVEQELAQAIENNQLRLYLQPIYETHNLRIVSVEALLRWQHPEQGLLLPNSFIDIAEESNLIAQVGEWVIREACRIVVKLRKHGHQQVSVAINVSQKQFADPSFPSTVSRILKQSGVSGHALNIEVTETTLMRDIDMLIENLSRLKQQGISISVDDFGTGYSSLSYLKRLPVDIIKIDRSFVSDIEHDPDDAGITEAIIAMAKKLRLKVIAEGVETQGQLDFLVENGCDMIQGNLLDHPEAAATFFNNLGHSSESASNNH